MDDWIALLSYFLVAGGGAFLGAYLKNKGKNLATKEDFIDLKKQTDQLTKSTEEIKLEIERRSYLGRQRWEAKRTHYMEIMSILNEIWSDYRKVVDQNTPIDKGKHLSTFDKLQRERINARVFINDDNLKTLNTLFDTLDKHPEPKSRLELIDHAVRQISFDARKDLMEVE